MATLAFKKGYCGVNHSVRKQGTLMITEDRIEELKQMHNAILEAKAHGNFETAAAFEALMSALIEEEEQEAKAA